MSKPQLQKIKLRDIKQKTYICTSKKCGYEHNILTDGDVNKLIHHKCPKCKSVMELVTNKNKDKDD